VFLNSESRCVWVTCVWLVFLLESPNHRYSMACVNPSFRSSEMVGNQLVFAMTSWQVVSNSDNATCNPLGTLLPGRIMMQDQNIVF
jgi:hypothetical protein